MKITTDIKKLINIALQEDAPQGDITARYFSRSKDYVHATIIAKQAGTLAGLWLAIACFHTVSKKIEIIQHYLDGETVGEGTILLELTGPLEAIVRAERVALNFLQHLSGVATATAELVGLLKGTKATLLDTRKTMPGFRTLDKYAVRCGGGTNHRFNLSDMILLKENHIRSLDIETLCSKIAYARKKTSVRIEIEAETLAQVAAFLTLPVDIIMLDNMAPALLKKAVALRNKKAKQIQLEASGNVCAKTIRAIARTGVDFISCGAITHSAKAFDVSLLVESL